MAITFKRFELEPRIRYRSKALTETQLSVKFQPDRSSLKFFFRFFSKKKPIVKKNIIVYVFFFGRMHFYLAVLATQRNYFFRMFNCGSKKEPAKCGFRESFPQNFTVRKSRNCDFSVTQNGKLEKPSLEAPAGFLNNSFERSLPVC